MFNDKKDNCLDCKHIHTCEGKHKCFYDLNYAHNDFKYPYCDIPAERNMPYKYGYPPIKGESPMEVTNRLYCQFEIMEKEWHNALHGMESVIHKAECAIHRNSAYYEREIKVETGYSETDNTQYVLITVPNVCESEEIKIRLHTAYDNTTNSNIRENADEASMFLLADKVFTAYDNQHGSVIPGWQGVVINNGLPLPSGTDGQFTVGFTCDNKMLWFNNNLGYEVLKRNGIVDSMGCTGIMINDGVITDSATYWGGETSAKESRICFGQTKDGKFTYILCAGNYDGFSNIVTDVENGLSFGTAAQILLARNCWRAVNVVHNEIFEHIRALDKGEPIINIKSENNTLGLAYWYISKKKDCWNNLTFDYAVLMQKYGRLKWLYTSLTATYLNITNMIQDLDNRLQAEIDRATSKENQINDDLQQFKTYINAQIQNITNSISQINLTIENIITRLDAIDDSLINMQLNIDTLEQRLTDLEENLDALTTRVSLLENDYNDFKQEVIDELERLNNLIAQHENRLLVHDKYIPKSYFLNPGDSGIYTLINKTSTVFQVYFYMEEFNGEYRFSVYPHTETWMVGDSGDFIYDFHQLDLAPPSPTEVTISTNSRGITSSGSNPAYILVNYRLDGDIIFIRNGLHYALKLSAIYNSTDTPHCTIQLMGSDDPDLQVLVS